MRSLRFFLLILLLNLLSPQILPAEIPYDVKFEGIAQKDIQALLKSVSQLVALDDHPPSTITGLRRRVEADIPNLIQGLHSLAYYDAKIDVTIDTSSCPAVVILTIEMGPVYTFSTFEILADESFDEEDQDVDEEEDPFCYSAIDLKNLGITLRKPALPKIIINAEKALRQLMIKAGYPLAEITGRDVIADYATKTIAVKLFVDSGPEAFFGTTEIAGNICVSDYAILKKIRWQAGDDFNPCLIEKTQSALESSALFSSVSITHAEEIDEDGSLPMFIEVAESRHRTVGFGAAYNTQLGVGITGEWEHRNVRGMGEKLRLKSDIWEQLQRGSVLYAQPDFLCPGQDLLWVAETEREITEGFTEMYFSFSGLINRKLNDNTEISYGGSFKELNSENSDNNGSFSLVKIPAQLKWSSANNLLDPTRGQTVNVKVVPTFKVNKDQMTYFIQTFTGTAYYALDREKRYVLAAKVNLGTILGASDRDIPPPERFYAGSENTLRGYQYLTVSPLDANNKPIGGRSLMIYSLELRARVTEKIGLVVFYDIGNVYEEILPSFDQKQLQSLGVGFRYHTPVGPLRADFAFPLNPRPGIDKQFQMYFSIGQAF